MNQPLFRFAIVLTTFLAWTSTSTYLRAQEQTSKLDAYVSTQLKTAAVKAVTDKSFPLTGDVFDGTLAVVEPNEHLHVKVENLTLADDTLSFQSTLKARLLIRGQLTQNDTKLDIDITADVQLQPKASIRFEFVEKDKQLVLTPQIQDLLAELNVVQIISPPELQGGTVLAKQALESIYAARKQQLLADINKQLSATAIKW